MSRRPHTHSGTRASSCSSRVVGGRELKRAVRQMVGAAMGHLGGSSGSCCGEVLACLAAMDTNFHCYELVRHLQGLISSNLSPQLAQKLADQPLLTQHCPSTAATLTEDLLHTTQYKELHKSLISQLRETVREMLNDSLHSSLSPTHSHTGSSVSQATQYFSLDPSVSSSTSDLSQLLGRSAGLCGPEQLLAISDDLAPSQPSEVRAEALQHLIQFPVTDLVAMDTWPQLKPVLSESLMDSDPKIAEMSLVLHSHLLFTFTPTPSLEALLSLTHQLTTFFLGKEGMAVTMAMGIDSADDRSLAILQRVRLLDMFKRRVPRYWLRFNPSTVQDIVRASFDLLLLGNDTPWQLHPIHYVCLVDPRAEWMREWTHAEFSRSVVFEALGERPQLDVVHCVMSSKPCCHGNHVPKHSSGFYNERSLLHLQFCHSLSLLTCIVRWGAGRTLLSNIDTFSISDILVHIIRTLYSLPPPPAATSNPWDHAHHVISIDPAHLVLCLLQELAQGSAGSRQLLLQSCVLSALLAPLKSLARDEGVGPEVTMETLERVGQVMSQLASSESGRSLLLRSGSHIEIMFEFVRHCLTSDATPVTPVVMTTWLFACRQIYKTGEGLVAMEKYQLHSHMAQLIKKVGVGEVKGQFDRCGHQIGRELVDNMLNLCWSSRGAELLGPFPWLLEMCVEYMWGRMKLEQQVSWCDSHGYGVLVSQLASTFPGARALIHSGVVRGVLCEVRECGEREAEQRLIAPWTHPLDMPDHALNKILSPLLHLISSFPLLHELLNSELSTSNTASTLISWLLGNQKESSLPQTSSLDQLVRARIISIATSSLDSLLLLQDRYNILDVLLRQQAAAAMENGVVPLDEVTILTNRTLVAGRAIGGGPLEQPLPPLSLSLPGDDYPWPLVTDYPLPSCFHGSVSWETELEKDSLLYSLLVDDHAHSRDTKGAWLSNLREIYCAEVMERGRLSNDLVAMVLEGVARSHPQVTSSGGGWQSFLSQSGVEMVVRYGEQLGLISPSHIPSLTTLLKPHPQAAEGHTHWGFDWLTGISFLLTRGELERATVISGLLHNVMGPSVIQRTCHVVEVILEHETPQLRAALQLGSCAVPQVLGLWVRQAFLNFLYWPQILLYIATTVVMGTNFQAYWCVSYLRSKEEAILLHSQRGDLLPHLLEYPTPDFQASQWLPYMRKLEEKFTGHMTIT